MLKDVKKSEQLVDIFDSDDLTIIILNADYEDIDSLNNLDITNIMRCIKHVKNMRYRIYLKYTIDDRNVKKKCIKCKIKYEIFF